jgi:hypothetical protein
LNGKKHLKAHTYRDFQNTVGGYLGKKYKKTYNILGEKFNLGQLEDAREHKQFFRLKLRAKLAL